MKRVALVSLVCACGVAGVLAAFALAAGTPLSVAGVLAGTTTSTTQTATTSTAPTTTAPGPQPLPEGVTIGGVPVGGLTPAEATAAIRNWFSTPLRIRYAHFRFTADPDALASPNVARAIDRARTAQPFQNVQLVVAVRAAKVKQYVAGLAKRIDRQPVDARLVLRRSRPFLTRDVAGRTLDRVRAERTITAELEENARGTIALRARPVAPSVTRKSFTTPVVVIRRGANRLYLYRGVRYWHTFQVATGQRQYPTPLGRFEIVVKWKNPWWYPPDSPWAKDEKPVPPGPGNPLGTRWMGLSSPGVGIHGTPDPASIGYSVSHGCIRMRISEAEWLFNHVDVGSPVFIVAS